MRGNGLNDTRRKLHVGQRLQNLGFGKKGIVQRDGRNLGMPLRQEGARHTRRCAPRQRQLLAQRQLSQARDQDVFRETLQASLCCRQQGELHEVHQVELTNHADEDNPRNMRMKCQGFLHRTALYERATPHDRFQKTCGEVFAFEQKQQMSFIQQRIVEETLKNLRIGIVNEKRDFVYCRAARVQ